MALPPSTKQKEDVWSWVEIGEPFPDGPMKTKGEQNQYVALWYKNGKPLCGRAWNNGGVVEASFPFKGKELTGKATLAGKIQILSYETWRDVRDVWKECGYWYDWVAWKDKRKDNSSLVKCGDVAPIICPGADGNNYSGNMEMSSETVTISYDGKFLDRNTKCGELLTIIRMFTDPGPSDAPQTKIYEDLWMDLREADDWARTRFSINRTLKGQPPPRNESSVALWYQCGQPVMGCIWNAGGKIACAFGYNGKEFLDKVGSIQVLAYDPSRAGFKISWEPYSVATKKGSGWRPCKVKDCAPCVIVDKAGTEHLGRVQVSEEKAAYPDGGKEFEFVGPQVQKFLVLCRTE